MLKRFSEMTKEELQQEVQKYKALIMKNEQAGFLSEIAIYEQKYYMAKSYLIDPGTIVLGKNYQVAGYAEPMYIDHVHGFMAWGKFPSSPEEVAVPLARLEQIIED